MASKLSLGESIELDDRMREFIELSEVKQLVYNIIALQHEKPFHSLAVLSFYPQEGKTIFSAALAMAYSDICRTPVLILDTTVVSHEESVDLRDCVRGTPAVSVQSLRELRASSIPKTRKAPPAKPPVDPASVPSEPVLEPEIDTATEGPRTEMALHKDNDFQLVKRAAEDQSGQYGLILVDTAPLHEKNRSNMDPLLVARLSDASVLVVSRKLLEAENLARSLKMIDDPALHLIGIIANEECGS